MKTLLIIFLSGFAGVAFAQQQQDQGKRIEFTSPAPTVISVPAIGGNTIATEPENIVFTSPEPTVIKFNVKHTGNQTAPKRVVFTSPEPQVIKSDDK